MILNFSALIFNKLLILIKYYLRYLRFFLGLAAKARSQSPYVPLQAREEFEKRFQHDENNDNHHRCGRSVSRSSSLRKRDSSWDKKWVEQVRRNKEEDGGMQEGGMNRETSPGKLNDGVLFWERQSRRQYRLVAILPLFLDIKNY